MSAARERILDARLCVQPRTGERRRRTCRFVDGRLVLGTASMHRLPSGRVFRQRLRLKRRLALAALTCADSA